LLTLNISTKIWIAGVAPAAAVEGGDGIIMARASESLQLVLRTMIMVRLSLKRWTAVGEAAPQRRPLFAVVV
jgi:hypothetical protein